MRKANSCLTDGGPCALAGWLARLGSARPRSLVRPLARLAGWLAGWPGDLDPSTSSARRRDARWVRACVTNSLTDAPHPSGRRRSARGWLLRRWRLVDDDDGGGGDGCDCGTALRIRGTERSAKCCDSRARATHGDDDDDDDDDGKVAARRERAPLFPRCLRDKVAESPLEQPPPLKRSSINDVPQARPPTRWPRESESARGRERERK